MSSIIDMVTAAITPAIQAPYELVDVEYGKMGGDYVLSIFVDKRGGISLQDTADLSEVISPILDTIKPDPFPEQYMLEVTSPGLERPLKRQMLLKRQLESTSMSSSIRQLIKSRFSKGLCSPLMEQT